LHESTKQCLLETSLLPNHFTSAEGTTTEALAVPLSNQCGLLLEMPQNTIVELLVSFIFTDDHHLHSLTIGHTNSACLKG